MRKKMFFFLLLITLLPNYVHAIDSRNSQLCINTGEQSRYYKLTSKGENVVDFYITYQDIEGTTDENQKIIYPAGCFCSQNARNCLVTNTTTTTTTNNTPQCKKEYQFSVEAQGSYCSISGKDEVNKTYNFSLCPTENEQNAFKQIASSIGFDGNNYTVKFDIPNEYKGKIIAKSVKKDATGKKFMVNKNGDPLPGGIATTYSAYQVENGISFIPGTHYYLILALSDSSSDCNGASLGYFQSAVPSTIPNSMYQSNECTVWRNKYASSTIGGALVSECYDEYIQYNEKNTIRSTVLKKIEEANSLLSLSTTTENKSLDFTCKFENNDKNINVNNGYATKSDWLEVSGAGTYWGAFCTETVSIEYDDPKAVKAGGGFGYNAKVTVQRECTPKQLKKPKNVSNCEYAPSTNGPDHNNDRMAGPSTAFDQCISNCDGGVYSQSCINSCYQSIYQKKGSLNSMNKNYTFSSDSYSKYLLRKTSTVLYNGSYPFPNAEMLDQPIYYGGSDQPVYGYVVGANNELRIPISSACVLITNDGTNGCNIECNGQNCYTEHGQQLYFGDTCNYVNIAYEIYLNYPCSSGTSSYEAEIQKSENEYNLVVAAIQKFNEENTKKEKYKLIVDEEYSKQKDGTYLKKSTTFTNNGNGNQIDSKVSVSSVTTTSSYTTTLADDTSGLSSSTLAILNKNVQKYAITRTIEVGIGAAYVSKVNGNDILYNQTSSNTDSSLDKNDKYYSAQNKYFTQFDTKFVNNYRNWPYYSADTNDSTDGYTKNIHVSFYNIGSWNQWGTTGNGVNINCLYGTAPGLICDDKNECPDDDNPSGTGIRYIFRPINLTDMFPNNRNPRFNWTGTINKSTNKVTGAAILKEKSYYDDAVDPETLISTIESKGESIYDVSNNSSEIDYEFVLTRENIRNIRSYNKHVRDYNGDNVKNYLDYNMSCYKNSRGQEVCTSKFLDNINGNSGSEENSNFITYSVGGYGMTERKSIAGCNNAINGTECDTISK
mgnify:CR=1 FL=1